MSSIKPHLEGITLEHLANPIRSIGLQPLFTGLLLAAAFQNPRKAEELVATAFKGRISLLATTRGLSAVLAVGILYRLSGLLSRLSLNNWISDRSWDWQKEIVVVTGGTSGIGALIARQLAERNIKTVILDVNPPQTTLPMNVLFYKTDVTSSENIAEVASEIRKDVGHPTVLVNNAGIGFSKPILDETEAQIRATFDVNNIAHFLLVKEFVPHMVERNHGHVVTVASLASFMVYASNVDYSCTKVAALAFHEGLAQELKHRYNANKVRTTIVHPTWVRTPLIQKLMEKPDWREFTIEPAMVAKAVVSQILKGESAQLVLPSRYSVLPLLRAMPSWIQEGMRDSVKDVLRDA